MLLKLVISSLLIAVVLAADPDYYWRSFHGEVPSDAVNAGQNYDYNIYIGRGSYHELGLFTGLLVPGQDSLTIATLDGFPRVQNKHLEVLCSGSVNNFVWAPTTNNTVFYNDGLIQGGYFYDDYDQVVYIGRYNGKNGYIVGWILSTDGHLRFTDEDICYYTLSYDVLVYRG